MSDYDTIKALEARFPLPHPMLSITVGTFNSATNDFIYAVPTYEQQKWIPPDRTSGGSGRPTQITVTGGVATAINTFRVALRFNVVNAAGTFSVSSGGTRVVAPAGQDFVEIDTGDATSMAFSLQAGNHVFVPDLPLKIVRHLYGAGAITIPALPISIVYAPPMDQQKKNVATWTQLNVAGTSTQISVSTTDSTTTPALAPFAIQPWLDLTTVMSAASKVLSKSDNAILQGFGAAFGIIAGLPGTSTNTNNVTVGTTDQTGVVVTTSSSVMTSTTPNGGGPGHADSIYALLNARVCWYTTGGPVTLALIGWDAEATLTADALSKANGATGLDDATRAALLALDPFVGNGSAIPPSPRFVQIPGKEVTSALTQNLSYTFTSTDLRQSVRTNISVEDDTASILAFANFGVPTTQKIQWTLTQTNAASTTASKTITRQLQLYAQPDEAYYVDVYVDTVFGTFAFRNSGDADELLKGSRTFAIDSAAGFVADGGATLAGFIPTGSDSEDLIATISGWRPNGGSHPTSMFVKRATQGGVPGMWFRINFVGDVANGTVWLTVYQGGGPLWLAPPKPTGIAFNAAPFH